eukprot:1181492-Prorocentrum_minimum.AAC.2
MVTSTTTTRWSPPQFLASDSAWAFRRCATAPPIPSRPSCPRSDSTSHGINTRGASDGSRAGLAGGASKLAQLVASEPSGAAPNKAPPAGTGAGGPSSRRYASGAGTHRS